jgi:osmotically inducible protein OsmC
VAGLAIDEKEGCHMPAREATARWEGSLQDGSGTMAFGSFSGPYSFRSRFEDGEGTNPEELLGAAHAGCFSMALSLFLGDAGHTPDSIDTTAKVRIEPQQGGGFAITRSDLVTRARVSGIDEATFQEIAKAAKANCPVSRALAGVEIGLDATLEG